MEGNNMITCISMGLTIMFESIKFIMELWNSKIQGKSTEYVLLYMKQ